MTDLEPDTGDNVLFAVAAVVFIGASLVGCHALLERLRGKGKREEREI